MVQSTGAGGGMNGASISRDATVGKHPDSRTDFADFFSPLFPKLAGLSWLVDAAMFSVDDAQLADFERDVLAHEGDCRYFRAGSLERWTRYLVDDWCTVLGFRYEPTDPRGLLNAAAGQLTDANIATMAPQPDVVFHCVDAARWTFYAHDDGLIRVVQTHASARGDLNVRTLTLGDDVA